MSTSSSVDEPKRKRAPHKPGCRCAVCARKRTGDLSADSPRLGVQVSPLEAALVRQAAKESSLSVNAWLRQLIQERFREELEGDPS